MVSILPYPRPWEGDLNTQRPPCEFSAVNQFGSSDFERRRADTGRRVVLSQSRPDSADYCPDGFIQRPARIDPDRWRSGTLWPALQLPASPHRRGIGAALLQPPRDPFVRRLDWSLQAKEQARLGQPLVEGALLVHQPAVQRRTAFCQRRFVKAAAVDGTHAFRGIPVRDDDRAGGRSSQRPAKQLAAIIGEDGHPEDVQQRISLLLAVFRLLVLSRTLLREQEARRRHKKAR